MKKLNVGIVGFGFVGRAVAGGFTGQNLTIIDPLQGTYISDLLATSPDVVFICVPTPMGDNGKIDSSIVEKVLSELKDLDTLLVLKSTVVPDIVDTLSKKYSNFIYNPEFLTEINADHDFAFPKMHIFGGDIELCKKLNHFYEEYSVCAPCEVKYMSAKEASFVKYSINSFLAMKVIFFNQLKDLVEKAGGDYSNVQHGVGLDPRIGISHTYVPGPDGRKGFGSACFSKDVPAIINYSDESLTVLHAAWNVNCDYRNSYSNVLPREKAQHIKFNKI